MLPNNQSPCSQQVSYGKPDWLRACQCLEQQGEAYCIATIVAEAGSLPRGAGSKIVVSLTHQFDTLGGGQLELEVVHLAREGLKERCAGGNNSNVHMEKFSLAADLAQSCGGTAQIMFEYLNTDLPGVVVFGAGHVSHSLCVIMKELPCHLLVVDSRKEWLDSLTQQGISTLLHNNPGEVLDMIAADSYLVIMTHDHNLDYEITRAALERNCFSFVGLIGSVSKKQHFERRLKDELPAAGLLSQLTCPIGHPDIQGKFPMQVAVSVSAQLIALFEQA